MTELISNAGAAPAPLEGTKLPSAAYKDATDSPVYRLSELMFGSLLAAYVLGFLGFAAGHAAGAFRETLLAWAPYLFVSVTYAYFTAGLYVSYHAGILTMDHMPLGRLRFDFMLALSQAVAFGFAMLAPVWFPATIAFSLLVSVLRQGHEHTKHVDRFYQPSPADYRRDRDESHTAFRKQFDELLKKYPSLKGWEPVSPWKYVQVVGLVSLSAVVQSAIDGRIPFVPTAQSALIIALVSFAVAAVVVWRVHNILGENAELLLNLKQAQTSATNRTGRSFDEQFTDFVQSLPKS
jgi:hypothetical protein